MGNAVASGVWRAAAVAVLMPAVSYSSQRRVKVDEMWAALIHRASHKPAPQPFNHILRQSVQP